MTDVFISYTRAEQPIAERLNELLDAEGWDVWFDQEIYAGATWESTILDVLAACKAVVVLWSQRSVASAWVRREATLALEAGKLVPIMIEPCQLPAPFAAVEAAQMFGWRGDEDHPELSVLLNGLAEVVTPSRIDTVRPGYDLHFLGTEIGLPSITGAGEEFPYLHFSVVMNPARRLAWYVAYTMRAPEGPRPERPNRWMPDPTLPPAFQPQNEHFAGTEWDRGHLVSPSSVAWGEPRAASIALRQSYFWTNMAPRHARLNREWWLALEQWERSVVQARGKAIGFSGPILKDDDPLHPRAQEVRGRLTVRQTFRIPRRFWKVVMAPGPGHALEAAAFCLDQYQLLADNAPRRIDPDRYRVALSEIEAATGLEFPSAVHEAAPLPTP